MQLTEGYKQTEVGVIPKDWKLTTIGSLADTKSGTTPPRALAERYYREGETPWVKTLDLNNSDITFTQEQVTDAALNETSLRCYPIGSVLVAMYGGYMQIGRTGILRVSAAVNQAITAVIPNVKKLDSEFLLFLLNYRVEYWKSVASSSRKDPNITGNDVRNFPIPLPPTKAEQEAIAGTLSDADAWIESLKQLIAKKRHIKEGSMQALLTGKQRLPGFSGKWKVKRLGEMGATYGGLTGKTKADFGEGDARYITFMNVVSNVVIDCTTFERVSVLTTEFQNRARKGDLFFNGSSETPEEVALCSVLLEDVGDVYLNSFCFGYRFRESAEANGPFFAYFLRGPQGRELVKSLAQGSTRYNISKTALLNSSAVLPDLPEQTAIADLLSDMDTELDALKAKLRKARQIKQGMMQELLTGRTRLSVIELSP
jgi:type I restriction enzyme S subunit